MNLFAVLAQLGSSGSSTTSKDDPVEQIWNFFLDWWWKALIILVIIIFVASAFQVVQQKTALVVERLGKFNRVMHAGLRFRIPGIDRVVAEMPLQIEQIRDDVKVKTVDNVFVKLPVSVQYRVQQDKVKEAYYELDDPDQIILALVLNEVKSIAAGMQLEDVFKSRDHLEQGVRDTLVEKFSAYGYEIINVMADNPLLSPELEESFNNVMAAQRKQEAATAEAEALRVRLVGEANANAEGLQINATAQVNYRNTLAEGNAAAVNKMTEGTNLDDSEILRWFMVTDSNDAIRDAAGRGATIVVATPNSSDGIYSVLAKTPRNGAAVSS